MEVPGMDGRVVSKYIETQDLHYAKNAMYRPRTVFVTASTLVLMLG